MKQKSACSFWKANERLGALEEAGTRDSELKCQSFDGFKQFLLILDKEMRQSTEKRHRHAQDFTQTAPVLTFSKLSGRHECHRGKPDWFDLSRPISVFKSHLQRFISLKSLHLNLCQCNPRDIILELRPPGSHIHVLALPISQSETQIHAASPIFQAFLEEEAQWVFLIVLFHLSISSQQLEVGKCIASQRRLTAEDGFVRPKMEIRPVSSPEFLEQPALTRIVYDMPDFDWRATKYRHGFVAIEISTGIVIVSKGYLDRGSHLQELDGITHNNVVDSHSAFHGLWIHLRIRFRSLRYRLIFVRLWFWLGDDHRSISLICLCDRLFQFDFLLDSWHRPGMRERNMVRHGIWHWA